jgi:hypothetical protein
MTYEYIYDEEKGFYYVPRAPSICEARTRESLFLKHFGETPAIVSPSAWTLLKNRYKTLKLKEE